MLTWQHRVAIKRNHVAKLNSAESAKAASAVQNQKGYIITPDAVANLKLNSMYASSHLSQSISPQDRATKLCSTPKIEYACCILYAWGRQATSIIGCSVLVSHCSFLKANGWELLGEILNLSLEVCNFLRYIVLQICLKVLQFGTVLLLQVLCDLHTPAHTNMFPCCIHCRQQLANSRQQRALAAALHSVHIVIVRTCTLAAASKCRHGSNTHVRLSCCLAHVDT